MDQATIDPASVPTATHKTRRPSGNPPLRTAVKKTEPKKVRKDGTVKTTLLLDAWIDDQLSALAFAWRTDRSELARRFIEAKLKTYSVTEELKRFVVADPPRSVVADQAKSDDDVNRSDSDAEVN
jgi:hypothetical protein